jgi:two-component system NarL family sensor kinase
MERRQPAAVSGDDPAAFREEVLRQVRELTVDNERLLQSVVRSEKRFRGVARAVWQVQEEERRRLARDLHDGIGQILTALANQLQRIYDDASAMDNLGLEQRLGDALDITRSALHDTREMSRLLRPTLLDDLGLDAALNWLARTLGERTGIAIELHSNLDDRRLAVETETLVFRITQEALTNIIRHSGAREAQIMLTRNEQALCLRVRDHGRGFDTARLGIDSAACGGGVRGMRDRTELFGGKLLISSAPGEGTTVQMTLTLDAAEDSLNTKTGNA